MAPAVCGKPHPHHPPPAHRKIPVISVPLPCTQFVNKASCQGTETTPLRSPLPLHMDRPNGHIRQLTNWRDMHGKLEFIAIASHTNLHI